MIRVTMWYEATQEKGIVTDAGKEMFIKNFGPEALEKFTGFLQKSHEGIMKVYPKGLMNTLADNLREMDKDIQVTTTTLYDPECGLPDDLLNNTDVLIWWAHISHDDVPDELVKKIVKRVDKGMGFIALHSAHLSKPFKELVGCSGTLKWREGDFCRVWNVNPTHPITKGIPEYFELDEEEMYGEPFDIAMPDENVFMSWYRGGELFRSGNTWKRGYGKVFYFQPGHETSPNYHNPIVVKIIDNAIHWAAPTMWRQDDFDCPNPVVSPEEQYRNRKKEQ